MFDPHELIAALSSAEVRFVVIGRFAVGAHGFPRATKDLDIVPDPSPQNLSRLASALPDLEAVNHGTDDLDPDKFPFDPLVPDQLAEGGNFLLMTRAARSTSCSGSREFPVTPRIRSSLRSTLAGHAVLVCSRDDLIAMKRHAGRIRISST